MFFYDETKQDNLNTLNFLGITNLKKDEIFSIESDSYQFKEIRHIKFYGVTLSYILVIQIEKDSEMLKNPIPTMLALSELENKEIYFSGDYIER